MRVIHLPRLTRILIAAVFALAVTLVLTPIIDYIYLEYFFSLDTREIPSILATIIGIAYYVLGWRLIVGYAGEAPTVRMAVRWYVLIGAAACLIVVILLIFGAISGTME